MKGKTEQRTIYKHLLLALLAVLFMFAVAHADPTDYISNYYSGTVSSMDGTGARMYSAPGSEQEPVYDSAGNNVVVPDGTKVFIYNEGRDKDLDIWYECSVTLDGVEYKGYLFTGRVTREDVIEFTPTPSPTVTPTPEIATKPISSDPTTAPEEMNEDTKEMIDKSEGFGPWKWIIVLIIVIILFMLVYTIWVKKNEERLEREIERYSGKSQYEPLDGELDEDFEEAKSNYYDSIGLGDQTDKDLGEEIGNPDDVQIDLSGIFEDESRSARKAVVKESKEDATLTDLIATLESRIGKDKLKEYDANDAYEDLDEKTGLDENIDIEIPSEAEHPEENIKIELPEEKEAPEEAELPVKEDEPEPAAEEEKVEKKAEPVVPEFVKRAGSRNGRVKSEPKKEEVKKEEPKKEEPKKEESKKEGRSRYAELFDDEEIVSGGLDTRDLLDRLKPGETINHRVYGNGKVVDNTDSEIIQVQFGKDMRYLKKDKLVKKELVSF